MRSLNVKFEDFLNIIIKKYNTNPKKVFYRVQILPTTIYNYKELRDELIKKGHVFANNADTEVLIHGYEEYGEELLTKLAELDKR